MANLREPHINQFQVTKSYSLQDLCEFDPCILNNFPDEIRQNLEELMKTAQHNDKIKQDGNIAEDNVCSNINGTGNSTRIGESLRIIETADDEGENVKNFQKDKDSSKNKIVDESEYYFVDQDSSNDELESPKISMVNNKVENNGRKSDVNFLCKENDARDTFEDASSNKGKNVTFNQEGDKDIETEFSRHGGSNEETDEKNIKRVVKVNPVKGVDKEVYNLLLNEAKILSASLKKVSKQRPHKKNKCVSKTVTRNKESEGNKSVSRQPLTTSFNKKNQNSLSKQTMEKQTKEPQENETSSTNIAIDQQNSRGNQDDKNSSDSEKHIKPTSTIENVSQIGEYSGSVNPGLKKQSVNKHVIITAQENIAISMAIKVGIGLIKDPEFMFIKGNLQELLNNSYVMNAIKEWKQSFKDDDIKLENSNTFSYYGHLLLVSCHREKLTRESLKMDFHKVIIYLNNFANSHKLTQYGKHHEIRRICSPINYLHLCFTKINDPFTVKIL